MSVEIASTLAQYDVGKRIFLAYAAFLGLDLEFQGFSKEMTTLQEMYGAPSGSLFLAKKGQEYIGAVGLRAYSQGVAEMKRLFVLPEHQGMGAGNLLVEVLIDTAKKLGYRSIKLDSIKALDKANAPYRKFGFQEIEPYRHNPYPDALFMERIVS